MDRSAILREAEERMKKALDHMQGEFRGVRSGRATPGLVENVKVNYYDTPTALRELASISTPDARTIMIKPFDPSSLKDVEKGILAADVGLTPNSDGKVVRISVPALSEDRRKKLVEQVKKASEECRVSIRNVRRDSNKLADDRGGLPEDDLKKLHDEIQGLLRKYEKRIDETFEKKKQEVLEI